MCSQPLQYSLFTHDCVIKYSFYIIFKFADDPTTDGDETACRDEVRALSEWCNDCNLCLNISKTKEMIVDISGAAAERVRSIKFLCVHLNHDLTGSLHTKIVVKSARHRPYGCMTLWVGRCSL